MVLGFAVAGKVCGSVLSLNRTHLATGRISSLVGSFRRLKLHRPHPSHLSILGRAVLRRLLQRPPTIKIPGDRHQIQNLTFRGDQTAEEAHQHPSRNPATRRLCQITNRRHLRIFTGNVIGQWNLGLIQMELV